MAIKTYKKADLDFIMANKHLAHLNLDWDLIRTLQTARDHPLAVKTLRPDLDLLRVIRDPKNFYFTCKYILNIELLPFQNTILQELWYRPFPMLLGSRGISKSFLLAIFAVLKALIVQGCKIAITGAVFRQSKVIFEYIEKIWNDAPILRDLMSNSNGKANVHHDVDRWWIQIGDSIISAFPIGPDGSKLRGMRANILICDEFASANPEIYETVIAGFAFVSGNPTMKVKQEALISLLKSIDALGEEDESKMRTDGYGNQSVLASTCYYTFNHLYQYFLRYQSILESKGDLDKLREIFKGEDIPEGFDWRDYGVIRLPIELAPKGMMEDKMIARQKLNSHSSIFLMEFGACFSKDSDGFFKRSTIEACGTDTPIDKACGPVQFEAIVVGNPTKRYVMGIDPAASVDKLAIVILELNEDHVRLVYCWTTDVEDHRKKLKQKIIKDTDYYGYVARKIRNLMKAFNIVHIAIDSQGGGNSVMESLRDKDKLEEGEVPILMIGAEHPLSDHKERDQDDEPGLHIIEPVNFRKSEWTSNANHSLKLDLEQKNILFPRCDTIASIVATELDLREGRNYDTIDDCICDIIELKDELASIVLTQTETGLEHFSTPEIKISGSKKGRARKDRYSALLMANTAARCLFKYVPASNNYYSSGGFAGTVKKYDGGQMYSGPTWFLEKTRGTMYGNTVSRSIKH